MPKSKEFVSDSDSDSDASVERKPKKKKAEKRKSDAESGDKSKKQRCDDEGNTMIQLSKMRFVSVSTFHGKKLINIREYYEKDGDLKPGRKGIALNEDQWKTLKSVMGDIDEALDNL